MLPLLYKYKPIDDNLSRLVESNSFYCCHQSQLNDVFEARYQLSDEYMSNLVNKSTTTLVEDVYKRTGKKVLCEEHQKDFAKKLLNTDWWMDGFYSDILFKDLGVGIGSFTRLKDNDVMWGNYADSFKGVCLEFDFNLTEKLIEKFHPVTYSDELMVINNHDMIIDAALRKKQKWKYEEEWRTLIFPGKGEISFNKESLIGVYFGVNVLSEKRNNIIDLILKNNYTTKFYQMKNVIRSNIISFEQI